MSCLRDLHRMLEKIELVRPGATAAMDRDGVSAWIDEQIRDPRADLRYWIVHPDDGTTTIMTDTGEIWWWEWLPSEERWVSSEERGKRGR